MLNIKDISVAEGDEQSSRKMLPAFGERLICLSPNPAIPARRRSGDTYRRPLFDPDR